MDLYNSSYMFIAKLKVTGILVSIITEITKFKRRTIVFSERLQF